MAVLTAKGIEKSYGQGQAHVLALARTDLVVNAGEFILISGPSGSGKSTLLAVVSGLLRPTSGSVEILGRDLWGLSRDRFDDFRLEHFGFIFQDFHLLPSLTAVEQVTIVLQRQGMAPTQARERAWAALDRVGISARRDSRPAELSGGERQRVAIARALAKSPQLIFADEPTSALDGENGRQLAQILRGAAETDLATIICVTHDPRLKPYASRVMWMEDGVLHAKG